MTTRTACHTTFLALLLLWGLQPAPAVAQEEPEMNIVEIVENTPRLSVLNRVLQASGMKDSLRTGGPYTMFLPVNEAFYELPYAERSLLWDTSNRARIRRILSNHILDRRMTSEEMAARSNIPSRLEDLPVDTTGNLIQVKGANILQPDVEAVNGMVHVIDAILMPSYVE
ncbi:MAG: fasciclin domain-containing protein [Balneolaceae bacterium]|nr:fasciclin domain-containing protein [Balneolaceae bacterium]